MLANFKRINKELTLRRVRFFLRESATGGYPYNVITDDTCEIRFASMCFISRIGIDPPYAEMRLILTTDDFAYGRQRQRVVSAVNVAFND